MRETKSGARPLGRPGSRFRPRCARQALLHPGLALPAANLLSVSPEAPTGHHSAKGKLFRLTFDSATWVRLHRGHPVLAAGDAAARRGAGIRTRDLSLFLSTGSPASALSDSSQILTKSDDPERGLEEGGGSYLKEPGVLTALFGWDPRVHMRTSVSDTEVICMF